MNVLKYDENITGELIQIGCVSLLTDLFSSEDYIIRESASKLLSIIT